MGCPPPRSSEKDASPRHISIRGELLLECREVCVPVLQLVPHGGLGDTTFQFVSSIVRFTVHFVYVINYAYYIK